MSESEKETSPRSTPLPRKVYVRRRMLVGLGANDGQDVKVDGVSYSPQDPEWSVEYERRVTELVTLVTSQGRSLVWVGTPDGKGKAFRANLAILRTATKMRLMLFGRVVPMRFTLMSGISFWDLMATIRNSSSTQVMVNVRSHATAMDSI